MADIIIHYKNGLVAKIESSPGIAYELSEAFAFMVPGAKFTPKYKAGIWDGKIRMFNIKTREMYLGLFEKMFDWCKESGYTVEYANKSDFDSNSTLPLTDDDWKWLKTTAVFESRWYQTDAVNEVFKNSKSLILSSTGSGKSFICYLIMRYWIENFEGKLLITVPSTSLVEQLFKDFESYVADDFKVSENVAKIYGGKDKYPSEQVVISTWQSAVKLPPAWFKGFNAYICDEAHSADGKSITAIVNNLSHVILRVGMTGTLDGTKMHELEMLARFGCLRRVSNTKDLQDEGTLAPIEIDCLQLRYTKEEIDLVKNMDYQQEISFLVGHEKRNLFLAKTAIMQKGNCLMLFNFIEKHGKVLEKILQPMCDEAGKKLFYISGEVSTEKREEIRAILETESNAILLASYATLSVGVNIKNLHSLIFCHPVKSAIRVLQSIGRILRKMTGKQKVKLIDIADDLSYTTRGGNKKQNTVLAHFLERLKIYVGEKWKYKIIPIQM